MLSKETRFFAQGRRMRGNQSGAMFVPGPEPRRSVASTGDDRNERETLPPTVISAPPPSLQARVELAPTMMERDETGDSTDCSGDTSDTREASSDSTGEAQDCSGETSDSSGETSDSSGETSDSSGETSDSSEESADAIGESSDAAGESSNCGGGSSVIAEAATEEALSEAAAELRVPDPSALATAAESAADWGELLAEARRQLTAAQVAFEQMVEQQRQQRAEFERQMRLNFSGWLQNQTD